MSRGTKAIINFDHLRHNFKILNALSNNKLVLVVKADAYGHGLEQIVLALDKAECFAVATIDEALTIRGVRPKVKILLLEGFLDNQELEIAFEQSFDCVIHQQLQIDLLDSVKTSKKMNLWLKYDSGMNRLGFADEEYTNAIAYLENHKLVNDIILMSHLASANQIQNNFTSEQTLRFLKHRNNQQISLSNSSALLNDNQLDGEWCRAGLALFGVSPVETNIASYYDLKPVMTLKANVIAIKQIKAGQSIGYSQTYIADANMQVAIIGIGYGDGYPWSLAKTAHVKINNQKATILGRVSMDMMTIDISEIPSVNVGDSVLIWGEDKRSQLPIETISSHAQTIPYVLLCQITSRVQYIYD